MRTQNNANKGLRAQAALILLLPHVSVSQPPSLPRATLLTPTQALSQQSPQVSAGCTVSSTEETLLNLFHPAYLNPLSRSASSNHSKVTDLHLQQQNSFSNSLSFLPEIHFTYCLFPAASIYLLLYFYSLPPWLSVCPSV